MNILVGRAEPHRRREGRAEKIARLLDRGSNLKCVVAATPMSARSAFTPAVIAWGVGVGVFQAMSPVVVWWLEPKQIWGIALAMGVIVVEVLVAFAFTICATLGIAFLPWLIVIGLVAHGLKDLWQHRTVRSSRAHALKPLRVHTSGGRV